MGSTLLGLITVLALSATPGPLARAQALYDDGEFQEALAVLATQHPDEPTAVSGLELLRARCHAALRRPRDVEVALEAALSADPTTSQSPEFGPGFNAAINDARARLAGVIEVDTTPPGAGVRIDQVLVGRAPLSQRVLVGAHLVETLDEAGAVTVRRELLVGPRSRQVILIETSARAGDATEPREPVFPLSWPVTPTLSARFDLDLSCPSCGVGGAGEFGVGVLSGYWLVEVSLIAGRFPGLGARAGARLPVLDGLLAPQVTADGVMFFGPSIAAGGGLSAGLALRPLSFAEVLLEGSLRWLAVPDDTRAFYGLVSLAVRFRLPSVLVR